MQCTEMKIAVVASLFAKRNVDVNCAQNALAQQLFIVYRQGNSKGSAFTKCAFGNKNFTKFPQNGIFYPFSFFIQNQIG